MACVGKDDIRHCQEGLMEWHIRVRPEGDFANARPGDGYTDHGEGHGADDGYERCDGPPAQLFQRARDRQQETQDRIYEHKYHRTCRMARNGVHHDAET